MNAKPLIMKRLTLLLAAAVLVAACISGKGPLPRAKASAQLDEAFASYLQVSQWLGRVVPPLFNVRRTSLSKNPFSANTE